MALREILLPWGVLPPPGEAAPNLSDPITSGLCAISFAHSGGVANIGVLGPVEPAAQRSGTGITVTPGSVGSGTTDGGTRTTNAWRLHSVGGNSAGTAWAIPSGAVTVAALIQRAGNPDGNSPIFGHNVPSSTPYGAWTLLDSTAGAPKFFISTSSSAFSEITGGAFTNGRLALVIGTWDGVTQRLYLDGAQVVSAAVSGTIYYSNDTSAGNTSGPSIGNFYDFTGTRSFNGLVHYGAVWNRALLPDEVARLAADPLLIFEPQRRLVVLGAGGGGATPQTLSSSLSLAVQVARSATASLGLAVQAPASATASVTLAVQQALTAQASLGTAVQLARTAAASLDTAVQTARSASTGTSLAVQAPASAVLSADIAVQQASSASASVDAYVQAATQLVASLDLLVQEGHALSVALEVAVQAARTGTSSVDLAVQAARAASTGVDTAVQQARSAAASVGLAVQAARAAGASVDLYVQAGFALVAGLDVAVRFAASAAASVDLAVATARSASVQIGAAVAVQQVLGAAMQAAVRASAVATCGVGLYVDDPAALVHSAAPLVPRVQGAARRAAVQSVIRAAAGQRTRR